MSLSKEEVSAAAATEDEEPAPRRPKCTRCRHHGIIVLLKGHRKWCPFLKCDCWKCYLITQRTQITTLQRSLKRGQSRPRPGAPTADRGRNPAAKGSPSAAAPDGGDPSPTSGLPGPRSAGALGCADGSTGDPREPRDRAAAGGESVVGLRDACYLGDGGSTAPQPVICYTGHFPSSFGLWPKVVYNVQQLPPPPPPPPGFYNGPCPVFTSFQQGAANYPSPPPEPGHPADCRRVFFTPQPPPLTDAPQEDVMSRPLPPPPRPI